MSVSRLVADVFQQHGSRPFLIEAMTGRRLSYRDFEISARKAARLLREAGVQPGDRVGLLLESSAEFAALYFACLFLGAVAVPLNPLLHAHEIDFIVKHARLKLLIHSPATDRLIASDPGCPTLRLLPRREQPGATLGMLLDALEEDPVVPAIDGDALWCVTFTSGTTALPKAIAHSASSIFGSAVSFNGAVGITADNRFLHLMPMAYMAGFLNTMLSPFVAGASFVLTPTFTPQTPISFWGPIREHGADTFWLSPTMAAALLALDRDPAGPAYARQKVKAIFVGTAPLSAKIKRQFEAKYGVPLLESYGLTEVLLVAANVPGAAQREGSVGPVLPGLELRIAEDGEICVRSPTLMAGYLDYATLQPQPLERETFFPSGDLGHLDADRQLFITGRKKDIIIKGGINVSPRAVEEVLLEHESVEQVAVVGLPHDFYGEQVVAALQLRSGRQLAAEISSLKALCASRLGVDSIPSRFVAVAALPANANGKIQKNVLREILLNEARPDASTEKVKT